MCVLIKDGSIIKRNNFKTCCTVCHCQGANPLDAAALYRAVNSVLLIFHLLRPFQTAGPIPDLIFVAIPIPVLSFPARGIIMFGSDEAPITIPDVRGLSQSHNRNSNQTNQC